ncbi:hypothetical protein V9T40_000202 [Parthenolecanium corni]|uniref:Uncharacterized protein n=1 Tax=Parthenolecanium corni TaxID=536013 RepID=A0AAN9TCU5_9HEMI
MTRRDGYAKLKSKPITIYHKQVFTIQNKEYIIFTDTQSLSSATRRPAFTHSRAVPQPQPQPQPQPPVTTTGPHSIDHSLIVDSSSSPMLPRPGGVIFDSTVKEPRRTGECHTWTPPDPLRNGASKFKWRHIRHHLVIDLSSPLDATATRLGVVKDEGCETANGELEIRDAND